MSTSINIIDTNEFLRSFEVKPKGAYDLFLGAGASVSAGIPTGNTLIWEFKRKLYCDYYRIKEEKFCDLESEINRKAIQEYFDQQEGFPTLNSEEEYSFYFEKCYIKSMDRKFFIESKVRDKRPTLGHKCLGELINSERIKGVWTANFDELIENGLKVVDVGKSFVMISPDNSHQLNQISNSSYPKIIKLHGDYRYDKLQNITTELQNLDKKLREHFLNNNKDKGLIVIGYEGNDESIMTVLEDSLQYENPFPFGLIWCVLKGTTPNNRIISLLQQVNTKNKNSGILEINSFDEFLYDLYDRCGLKNSEIENIAENLFIQRRPFVFQQASLKISPVKLNAIRLKRYPTSLYSFNSTVNNWPSLREVIQEKDIVAALYNNKILAFGDINNIKESFRDKITSEINIIDVDSKWLHRENSFFKGMLYDLIALTLIKRCGLLSNGKHKRTFYLQSKKIFCPNLPSYLKVYEAFEVRLDFRKDSFWFLILPTVEVVDSRDWETFSLTDKKKALFKRQSIINSIVSRRYNQQVNKDLEEWLNFIKNKLNSTNFYVGDFDIELENGFAYGGYKFNDQNYFFQGLLIEEEPKLFFHINESKYQSIHPLKGLRRFNPYDYSFESNNSLSTIKLAIIAPKSGFKKITAHLNSLSDSKQAITEKNYLIEYPGFSDIYKKYLEIPNDPNDKLAVLIDDQEVQGKTHIEFYNILKRKIDYFDTLKGDFSFLVIYSPNTWSNFRELKNEDVYFDLHDSIKIYCAKKNIKVQFIEDKSICYCDQAKVRWWLSLATYVKSNGVPWKTQIIRQNTAFIGIGYAVKRNQKNRLVIGCSQLFDSSGRGLRFLLQPIEKPIYYGKTPFLSKEDMRRLILKLKEAYFKIDPNLKLDKLVVHKTNYFTGEEMEGIAQAAEGINNVELLQIQQYTPWRGIRTINERDDVNIYNYPILRGTCLQLDDYTFLLWTHGSVMNDELAGSNRNYYQGGRGIPIPLVIRRFRGNDPHEIIIKEILNLTKMNWNGCQLYKNIPVTLDFSKMLSEIAKQDELLNNVPYDFRFFM
jgi:NAD-dependent SIR2 family protein deacetylase